MRLPKLPMLALILLLVAGCQSSAIHSIAITCASFLPISYSVKNDSIETVAQIRGHNAAYCGICIETKACQKYFEAE